MNENLKKMNKLDLFKSYNNNISDGDITSIIKVYDKKYVTLINNLSSLISNFVSNTKAFIKALSEVCSTMKNQILYSQHLLLEINNKKEKFSQLYDRVEMIDNTRKLLDNHLLIINNNLNIFITEAKKEFKDIINLRMEKLNAISKMKNNKKCDSLYNNKSTSRAKIKKNFFEMENYFSNDNIASNNNNNKKNVYNNFIQCSDMQKNYSLLEKQNNYRKANFNQTQEQFYPKKNKNIINKQKSESVLRGKYSRNKINVFQNSFSSRYNNSSTIAKQIEQPGKSSRNNSNGKDINSIELKLAYKVLEFILSRNQAFKDKNVRKINLAPLNPRITSNHCYIFISGFLSENSDHYEEWENMALNLSANNTCYFYNWPGDCLSNAASETIVNFGLTVLNNIAKQKLNSTPEPKDCINNTPYGKNEPKNLDIFDPGKSFIDSSNKAALSGEILALILASKLFFKYQTITLVGFSLGTHVTKHCIKKLYELHYKEHIPCNDIIKDVILIAGATSVIGKEEKFKDIFNKMINGKLINCYSKDDQVLNVLYTG